MAAHRSAALHRSKTSSVDAARGTHRGAGCQERAWRAGGCRGYKRGKAGPAGRPDASQRRHATQLRPREQLTNKQSGPGRWGRGRTGRHTQAGRGSTMGCRQRKPSNIACAGCHAVLLPPPQRKKGEVQGTRGHRRQGLPEVEGRGQMGCGCGGAGYVPSGQAQARCQGVSC